MICLSKFKFSDKSAHLTDGMVKQLLRYTIEEFEIRHKKDLEEMMTKALSVKEQK